MLYLLLGEDDFSIHEALEEIKKSIGDQTVLAANTTVLDGQQVTLEQLSSACETVPFLAERRLIIVEGLLGRFEPGNKSGRKKAARRADRQDEHQPIVDCVSRIPDFAALVMVVGGFLAFSIIWYLIYTRGKRKRDYALQCVIERIKGSREIPKCLDDEVMEADAEVEDGDTS